VLLTAASRHLQTLCWYWRGEAAPSEQWPFLASLSMNRVRMDQWVIRPGCGQYFMSSSQHFNTVAWITEIADAHERFSRIYRVVQMCTANIESRQHVCGGNVS